MSMLLPPAHPPQGTAVEPGPAGPLATCPCCQAWGPFHHCCLLLRLLLYFCFGFLCLFWRPGYTLPNLWLTAVTQRCPQQQQMCSWVLWHRARRAVGSTASALCIAQGLGASWWDQQDPSHMPSLPLSPLGAVLKTWGWSASSNMLISVVG